MNWGDLTREELGRIASDAVVVLPVGATEQHGPHLPTSTDSDIVTALAERACALAESEAPTLLTPTLPFGASDHHLPFGATLSLSLRTFEAVVIDLLRSIALAGGKRMLLLNGHGGNAAACHCAAAEAALGCDAIIAVSNYWELLDAPDGVSYYPGHAGAFETALMLEIAEQQVRTDLIKESPAAPPPRVRGVRIHERDMWRRIDGFTDDPSSATRSVGADALNSLASAIADVVRRLYRTPIADDPGAASRPQD